MHGQYRCVAATVEIKYGVYENASRSPKRRFPSWFLGPAGLVLGKVRNTSTIDAVS